MKPSLARRGGFGYRSYRDVLTRLSVTREEKANPEFRVRSKPYKRQGDVYCYRTEGISTIWTK